MQMSLVLNLFLVVLIISLQSCGDLEKVERFSRDSYMSYDNGFNMPAQKEEDEILQLYNFVAGSKVNCEGSIDTRFPGKTGVCTIGGGCGISCGKPNGTCESANPTLWGLCTDGSDLFDIQETSQLYNFVAGSKANCEGSIGTRFPGKTGVCTIGGGCGISCGKPGGTCESANPTLWGLCTDGSDLVDIQETSQLYNFVAGSKATCEGSIGTRFPGKTGICTIGGGCGISCGKPSGTCESANPTLWGLCTDGTDLF